MKSAIAGGAQCRACWNAGYRCEQIGDVVGCMTDDGFVYQYTRSVCLCNVTMCLSQILNDIFLMPTARYSPFVLKVSLKTNQKKQPAALRLVSASHSICKSIWNHFYLISLSVCDNVHTDYLSPLVAVCSRPSTALYKLSYLHYRHHQFSASTSFLTILPTITIFQKSSVSPLRIYVAVFLFNLWLRHLIYS